MAVTNTTQFANRYGLDIKIYELGKQAAEPAEDPIMTIGFANECALELSGERVWATGGQAHSNKIAFNDPIEGTFTISTQVMTSQVIALVAGADVKATPGLEVTFENTPNSNPKYYTVVCTTVWQDAAGVTYDETITLYKATPSRAFNITYSGEGEPLSVDVQFDLLEDDSGKVVTITKADKTVQSGD